ncbi:MAG: hypothetical protein QW343_03840, partial [Candidatus Norongarragalinales archaeon]
LAKLARAKKLKNKQSLYSAEGGMVTEVNAVSTKTLVFAVTALLLICGFFVNAAVQAKKAGGAKANGFSDGFVNSMALETPDGPGYYCEDSDGSLPNEIFIKGIVSTDDPAASLFSQCALVYDGARAKFIWRCTDFCGSHNTRPPTERGTAYEFFCYEPNPNEFYLGLTGRNCGYYFPGYTCIGFTCAPLTPQDTRTF